MGDIGASLAWLGIVTALCTCVASVFAGHFAHQRRIAKLQIAERAAIRSEQSMATGQHLDLLLAQVQLDLEKQKEKSYFRLYR